MYLIEVNIRTTSNTVMILEVVLIVNRKFDLVLIFWR